MKPSWFRIHLSTALVLVLAASIFVTLNFLPSPPGTKYCGLRPSSDGPTVQIIASDPSLKGKATFRVQWDFGFPVTICNKIYDVEAWNDATVSDVLARVPVRSGEFGSIDLSAIFENIFYAVVALFFLAICSEIIIHFRGRRGRAGGMIVRH